MKGHNQVYRLEIRENYIHRKNLFFKTFPILVKIENIGSYNIAFTLINEEIDNSEVKYLIIPHSQIEFLAPVC